MDGRDVWSLCDELEGARIQRRAVSDLLVWRHQSRLWIGYLLYGKLCKADGTEDVEITLAPMFLVQYELVWTYLKALSP